MAVVKRLKGSGSDECRQGLNRFLTLIQGRNRRWDAKRTAALGSAPADDTADKTRKNR